jgi:hypothetical protein
VIERMTSGRGRLAVLLGAALAAAALAPAARADSLVFVKAGNVWISHSDGSAARQVTTAANNWAWPSAADDGTIVVAGGKERVNAGGTDSDGSSEIYRFDQLGRRIGGTVDTPGTNSSPACPTYPPTSLRVSPNGQRVAYDAFSCDAKVPYLEDFATGHFASFAPDYGDPLWLDDGRLLITHIGVTFGNAPFAVYDTAAATGHGPSDDPYLNDRHAVASRDGNRVAVLEDDPLIDGSGAASADLVLYATTGGDVTQPVQKCKLALNAGNIHNYSIASPTFSPDGSKLAWAENDGIHVANTANLDDCASVTQRLLAPGGAYPFFAKADAAAVKPTLSAPAKTAKLSSGGALGFFVTSNEDAGGTATGTVSVRKGVKVRFTKRALRFVAGQRVKVTLKLSKKSASAVRKALKPGKAKLTARITLVARALGGPSSTTRIALRLGR